MLSTAASDCLSSSIVIVNDVTGPAVISIPEGVSSFEKDGKKRKQSDNLQSSQKKVKALERKRNVIDFTLADVSVMESLMGSKNLVREFREKYFQYCPMVSRNNDGSKVEAILHDLNIASLLSETSSESIQVWMRDHNSNNSIDNSKANKIDTEKKIQSIRVSDPRDAEKLYKSGHSLYCRAPKEFEDLVIPRLLDELGLGPLSSGNDRYRRGEVEIFFSKKGHVTDFHTDFQENFTVHLTGQKRWSFAKSSAAVPIRGCTPHFDASEFPEVAEQQLKCMRLIDPAFQGDQFKLKRNQDKYDSVILHPGDVLYHPAGIWHRVECLEDSIAINLSLISTSHADLVVSHISQLLLQNKLFRSPVRTNSQCNIELSSSIVNSLLGTISALAESIKAKDILTYPMIHKNSIDDVGGEENEKEGEEGDDEDEEGDEDEEEDEEENDGGEEDENDSSDQSNDEEVEEEEEEEEERLDTIVRVNDQKIDVSYRGKWFKFNPFSMILKNDDLNKIGGYTSKLKVEPTDNVWIIHSGFGNETLESASRVVLHSTTRDGSSFEDETLNCIYEVTLRYRQACQDWTNTEKSSEKKEAPYPFWTFDFKDIAELCATKKYDDFANSRKSDYMSGSHVAKRITLDSVELGKNSKSKKLSSTSDRHDSIIRCLMGLHKAGAITHIGARVDNAQLLTDYGGTFSEEYGSETTRHTKDKINKDDSKK